MTAKTKKILIMEGGIFTIVAVILISSTIAVMNVGMGFWDIVFGWTAVIYAIYLVLRFMVWIFLLVKKDEESLREEEK